MNKGKKLILAVLCGLPADHKVYKEAAADPAAAAEMLAVTRVTKQDLLEPIDGARNVFAFEQTWDRFARLMAQTGERFTIEDLSRRDAGGTSLVEYAVQHGKLEQLFTPEIWRGRIEDMDNLYYGVKRADREKIDYPAMRSATAALTGIVLAEDKLKKTGMAPSSVRTRLTNGTNITDLRADLARNGDRIRKEYVLMLSSEGDNIFDNSSAFNNMHLWLEDLEKANERLTKADFLRTYGNQKSILQNAMRHDALPKIFTPAIWKGRPKEMLELFEQLPPADRTRVDIAAVVKTLRETEYGERVRIDSTLSRATLTAPLNQNERWEKDFAPVCALSLTKVWKDIAQVRGTLSARGEKLTTDDLRRPTGFGVDNVMTMAAREGQFAAVMDIAAESGQKITLADLTTANTSGQSIADILIKANQSALMFRAENWVGQAKDMARLWEKLPELQRKAIDFPAIQGRVNALTLREKFAGPRMG